jgi:hypothetical protein
VNILQSVIALSASSLSIQRLYTRDDNDTHTHNKQGGSCSKEDSNNKMMSMIMFVHQITCGRFVVDNNLNRIKN